MKIYYNLEEVEEHKRSYASIAFASKVRVEYEHAGEKHALIPVTIGDFTVLIEIDDDREVFNTWVKKLKESTKVEIKKPIEAVNNIVRHLNLSEEEREKLLIYFSEPTKYGLINAVTNLAAQVKNVEEQIKLEEFAGKILVSRDLEREVLQEVKADV